MPSIPSLAFAALFAVSLPAQQAPQPDDLVTRVRATGHDHPRLFLDADEGAALKRRIAADPAWKSVFDFVQKSADVILAAPPVERRKVGRRLLSVSRTCLKRVLYLAFAYRMNGDRRYVARAAREMLAAAAFQDWNPSHFLDVAEMTAALALGYDWLHAELSPAARKTIRRAIVEKGLRTSLSGGWWVKTTNNWNQVCHGGLSLGALAVLHEETALAKKILRRAIDNLPRAMHEYAPDGAYPEGPGYWNYGTIYNVLFLDALRSVLRSDFGLTQAKGFLSSSDYYLHMTGPTGMYFNYSDCGKRGGVSPAMYWFDAQRQVTGLRWNERHALQHFLKSAKPNAGRSDRLLPFVLVWAQELSPPKPPAARHFWALGRTPVAVHRSGWEKEATFVAIKGGSPSTNHAHMDIGSFVMDAQGVRWAQDLGSQSYHSLESKGLRLWGRDQKSQRWTVFRLNSLSHNTLVVDGKHQRVKGVAPIVAHKATGPMPHTIVDLSAAYRGQLKRARRGIGLRADGVVVVQDEFEALDRGAKVRWAMVTRAKVVSIEGNRVVLARNKKKLTLRAQSPTGAQWKVIETASPKASYDAANPGTRMLGFVIKVEANAKTRWAVTLTPGDVAAEVGPEVRRLRDW